MSLLNRMFGWIFGSKNSWWNPLSANKNVLRNIVYGDSSSSSNTNAFTDIFGTTLPDLIQSITNRYTAEHMTGADREAAELSYQQQEQFYNDYQSPLAQVRQYQQAGLNPALMMGNGAHIASPIAGNAQASAPSIDFGQVLSTLANVAFRAKEVSADYFLKRAQGKLLLSQAQHQENENSVWAEKYNFWKENQRATLSNISADTFLKWAQKSLADQNVNESEARSTLLQYQAVTEKSNSEWADRMNEALYDLRISAKELNEANASYANNQSKESEQRLNEAKQSWGSRWKTLQETARKASADAGMSENEAAAFWTDKRLNELLILSECFSNYKKQFKIGPIGGEDVDWQRWIDKNGPSWYHPLQ